MIGVADARDALGTPIRSLYGERFEDLSPRARRTSRPSTSSSSTCRTWAPATTRSCGRRCWPCGRAHGRACASSCSTVPTPSAADVARIEGRRQRREYCSFVGLEPIPVRHALTLGEIVAWRAQVEGLPLEAVRVLGVAGLAREAHATGWDRPFVMPSPNMPTYETALVYPGGCLVEGTNLSEGRGTTRPFEIVGAPWIDGARLADELHALSLARVPRAPDHVPAHVPEARGPRLRRRPGPRHRSGRASVPSRPTSRSWRSRTRRTPSASSSGRRSTSSGTTCPRSICSTGDAEARERIARGDRAGDVAEAVATVDARRPSRSSLEAIEAGRVRRLVKRRSRRTRSGWARSAALR